MDPEHRIPPTPSRLPLGTATALLVLYRDQWVAIVRGFFTAAFAGRSQEKSWLVGILKNKIFDYYRRASRETSFTDLQFYQDEEADRFVGDGLSKGSWVHELGPME